MALRKRKPTSPGRRFQTSSDFSEITKHRPEPSLRGEAFDRHDGAAVGRRGEQHRVAVAVQPGFDQPLRVAGRLALAPERLARARPVHRLAGLDRAAQRDILMWWRHDPPRETRRVPLSGFRQVACAR